MFPDRQLAYTVLGRPADPTDVVAVVADYLDGAKGTAPIVFVDDLAPMVSDIGVSAATDLVDGLSLAVREAGGSIVVGYSVTPSTATAVGRAIDLVDEVGGVETDAIAAIERLRRRDPTTFGYTRRYWEDARDGIDACDRNYPQSKQIHAALETTDTTPRTLGATLSGLVELGVLGTWGKTVGSTRYDLTAYDPVRLASVGVAFAVVTDRVGYRRGSST
ncbi:hypothetical protein GRS48_07140 [Halorubrum sp. JWXQ-INN 858]|nr:hypothetical protein [Halorubrum sp. JWXQ-INN 858]